MTTLTFHLGRALGRGWGAGDEIVVTELDHHANVAPWRALERERGVTIRVVPVVPATGELDWPALERSLSARTRLLAIGAASNALGTVNDVTRACALARAVGRAQLRGRRALRAARRRRRPRASAATSWPARPTSSMARMSACSTAGASGSRRSTRPSSRPRRTRRRSASRPARSITRASWAPARRWTSSRRWRRGGDRRDATAREPARRCTSGDRGCSSGCGRGWSGSGG